MIYNKLFNDEQEVFQFLTSFKTESCKINQQHDIINCIYYHSQKQKRRKLFDKNTKEILYQPIICTELECNDQLCIKCHNNYELYFHPQQYKYKQCDNITNCKQISKLCYNYHSIEEKRPKEITIPPMINNGYIFNVDNFKTEQCTRLDQHNFNWCPYFHALNSKNNDRRRSQNIYEYGLDFCKQQQINRNCLQGDMCKFAHNKQEQLYHKYRYKTKFCEFQYWQQCQYGYYCGFAHQESEISIQIIDNLVKDDYFYSFLFKTIWCPNTKNHERSQCVYAHNVQDFRRDPILLLPEDCPHWNKKDNITIYANGGCKFSVDCQKCHGWKELEYHPLVYKTQPCIYNNCQKQDCAYYHNQNEINNNKFKDLIQKKLQFHYKMVQQKDLFYKGGPLYNRNMGMPMDVFVVLSNSNFKSPIKLFSTSQNPNIEQVIADVSPIQSFKSGHTLENQQQIFLFGSDNSLTTQQPPKRELNIRSTSFDPKNLEEMKDIYQKHSFNTKISSAPDSPLNKQKQQFIQAFNQLKINDEDLTSKYSNYLITQFESLEILDVLQYFQQNNISEEFILKLQENDTESFDLDRQKKLKLLCFINKNKNHEPFMKTYNLNYSQHIDDSEDHNFIFKPFEQNNYQNYQQLKITQNSNKQQVKKDVIQFSKKIDQIDQLIQDQTNGFQ